MSVMETEFEKVGVDLLPMTEQRFKGEVNHCLNIKEIEWKIPRFITTSEKIEVVFESPEFYFMGSEYQLVIRSDDYEYSDDECEDYEEEDDTYHFLFLRIKELNSLSSRKIEVTFNFTWSSKENGVDIKYKLEKSLFWDFKTSVLKLHKFERSKLIEQSTGCKDDWVLTVFCHLRSFDLKKESEEMPPMMFRDLTTLSSDLEKLFNNSADFDIILRVQGVDYRVHRSILNTRSEALAAVCRKKISESSTKEVDITDCDPEAFGIFLKYLYSGCTEELSVGSALHLLKIAVKFSTVDLRSFCVDFLRSHLTVDTVSEVASAAQMYGEEELMSSVQAFFDENIAEIFSKQSWETLMKEDHCLANKLLKGMAEAK